MKRGTTAWRCGRYVLPIGERTLLMAIINVTPDSFSGDGWGEDVAAAVAAGEQAAAAGADLLDVGGASTRPQSDPVGEPEEARRVIPVIERLARRVTVPVSVDTGKPGVAAAALAGGAQIVNAVSGLADGTAIARLAAEAGAGLILMRFPGFPFNRPAPRQEQEGDLIAAVRRDLLDSVRRAQEAGVAPDRIVLDPGFGFGLVAADSIELLRRLGELRDLGYPLLAGVSRKGFTGQPDHLPVSARAEGTIAAQTLAIAHGAAMLRVHDVVAARRAARFTDLVVRGAPGSA